MTGESVRPGRMRSLREALASIVRLDGATAAQVFRLTKAMLHDKILGRRIIIIFVEEPGFVQFLLPVHRELVRRAGARLVFYLATNYADREEDLAGFHVPRQKRFRPGLARAFLMADIWLSASVYGRGPVTSTRINISHNQPTKFEAYPREHVRNYDVHFLTGPLHRQQYEHMLRLHGLDTHRYRLIDIGYPKSDALHRGEYDRGGVLRDLGLEPARKTVLYAPAWDPGGSLRSFGEETIEQLLSLADANVIVKLHPVSHTPPDSPSYESYTGGVNWRERLSRFDSNPRFRHVTDFQVDPLLVAADLLVTDFSSVALEFIGLDKPVIYLDCPEYFEQTLRLPAYASDPEYVRNDPRANAGRHVGTVVAHVSELANAAAKCLANPGENSLKRRELAAMLLYNPGRGAEAAAGAILELVGLRKTS